MKEVPISDVPAQEQRVILGGKACKLVIRERSTGVFLDLYVDDAPVVVGVICRNRVRMVRSAYLGFPGDLAFVDQQGYDDPSTPGLGTRFLLMYFEASELG